MTKLSTYNEYSNSVLDRVLCYKVGTQFRVKFAAEFTYDELMEQRYIMAEHATAATDEDKKEMYRREIKLYNVEIDMRHEIKKARREMTELMRQRRVESIMETIYR